MDYGLTIRLVATIIAALSATLAFLSYASSLRPYMYIYLELDENNKDYINFIIENKGKVGAKSVKIKSANDKVIYRFTSETAREKSKYGLLGDDGHYYNLTLPRYHQEEVLPPDFKYLTLLGGSANVEGNENLTNPFVINIEYNTCLPLLSKIPYLGKFKESFYINPRMFGDAIGIETKTSQSKSCCCNK